MSLEAFDLTQTYLDYLITFALTALVFTVIWWFRMGGTADI